MRRDPPRYRITARFARLGIERFHALTSEWLVQCAGLPEEPNRRLVAKVLDPGRAAAIHYSLVESCKANEINPLTYLTCIPGDARNETAVSPKRVNLDVVGHRVSLRNSPPRKPAGVFPNDPK